jgi:hypothetical protein
MNRAIKMKEKRTKRMKEESIAENPDVDFPLVFHIPIFLSRLKSFFGVYVLYGRTTSYTFRNLPVSSPQ